MPMTTRAGKYSTIGCPRPGDGSPGFYVESFVKRIVFLAALTAALCATPSLAQQGPAGVPGVFGLAESVTGPTPPPARPAIAQAASRNDCSLPANAARCQARETQKKAREACAGQTGNRLKSCVAKQVQTISCKRSADPARCLQHQKARQICSPKLGDAHRQCLRENLAATR